MNVFIVFLENRASLFCLFVILRRNEVKCKQAMKQTCLWKQLLLINIQLSNDNTQVSFDHLASLHVGHRLGFMKKYTQGACNHAAQPKHMNDTVDTTTGDPLRFACLLTWRYTNKYRSK